jgi:FkbM family methyltransferase
MAGFVKRKLRVLAARRRIALGKKCADAVAAVLSGEAIVLLDVGASGGIIPRWSPYRADIAFIGVEPDARSLSVLLNSPESKLFRSYEIIPFGAWNRTGTVGISFTRKPMCSSHFAPNIAFLSRFPEVERFDIVGSTEVECRMVDDLLAGSGKSVDFIKLDLEGGELAVIEGATKSIEGCMGLHVEVCFQSIRDGQPLFGDITNFL